MDMKIFYLTFGKSHVAKDGYVKLHARNLKEATELVQSIYGRNYADIYDYDGVNNNAFKHNFFPQGKLGELRL